MRFEITFILPLHCSISPSTRLSWLSFRAVSSALSLIFRLVSLMSVSFLDLSRRTSFSERLLFVCFDLDELFFDVELFFDEDFLDDVEDFLVELFFFVEVFVEDLVDFFFELFPFFDCASVVGRAESLRLGCEAESKGIISSRVASRIDSSLDTMTTVKL